MTLKRLVLEALEAQSPLSGQRMAERFQVSRAAIWKAVAALRNDGYQITGENRCGYTLCTPAIRAERVKELLRHDVPVLLFSTVDSTNERAKAQPEDCVILSLRQSAGKAKQGKSFPSDAGGIYFSVSRSGRLSLEQANARQLELMRFLAHYTHLTARGNEFFRAEEKCGGVLTESMLEFDEVTKRIFGIGFYPAAYSGDPNRLIADTADFIFQPSV